MGVTTRAWRVHAVGEPRDVLRWDEIELDPGPGELLVEVEAAAANFVDVLLCRGRYQMDPQIPFTLGIEACGRVVSAGEGTTTPVGQRVITNPWMPGGGLAEMMLTPDELAYPIDDDLDARSAAALHTAYVTALVSLERRAQLQRGEILLVHAGAGSVGSAAIQVGLAMGARVLATAGSPEKLAICEKLGAERALLSREDFAPAVLEATGGHGADVVYDSVGGDVFHWSRRCVAFEGRILIIGFTSGRIEDAPTNHALLKGYSIVGSAAGLYRDRDTAYWRTCHERVMALHRDGLIDPLLDDARLTIADAPEALTRLANRQTIGKLVLTRT